MLFTDSTLPSNRPVPSQLLQIAPFWNKVVFLPLPPCSIRLNCRVPSVAGTSIHHIPGVADAQKRAVQGLRSVCRTIHIGGKWTDFSGTLELGIFFAAYVGADLMSDRQASLMRFRKII